MASIRKRGGSYLIAVSMGYDYNGKRIRQQQKTVHPPEALTRRQVEAARGEAVTVKPERPQGLPRQKHQAAPTFRKATSGYQLKSA